MSYDDWKTTDPRDAEPETCDCGAELDESLEVSMCLPCYEACEPVSAGGFVVEVDEDIAF